MSVVIRDIDKPRDCDYCHFQTDSYCHVLLSYINVKHGVDTRCPIIEINEYTWGAVYLPNKVMNKYTRDKQRMDEIAERLSQRQDIWQDRYIYWIAVAVGHILEGMIKMKPGDINEDGKEIEQDMNITWEEFNETLPNSQKILSIFSQGTEQSRGDSK